MFLIKDYASGATLEETLKPEWVRKQEKSERLARTDNINDADGVILSDEITILGIAGRNMENYTPLVKIVEISGEPYIMQQIAAMQAQVNAMQAQSTTTGEQVKEIYASQAGDTVVKSELDAAYKEGVNSL